MSRAADRRHMARALQLARRGLYTTDPNPRVGCVLVRDGAVVGEGWHVRAGQAHAEQLALTSAGDAARGATGYVNLEPCDHEGHTPACTGALIDAGIVRVVAAMADPHPLARGGAARLRDAGVEVEIGLMDEQAQALNPGFVSRLRRGRPWVRAKLGASLDGRTAMQSGESQWITGSAAREDVQRWRARSSAIVTGIGTVLADDPRMDVRLDGVSRQPLRVVVDSHLSMPGNARMLGCGGDVLVVTADERSGYADTLRAAGAQVQALPGSSGTVDLTALMDHLAAQGVNEILLETGATLCGAMLEAGLVDELIIYFAPFIMGDRARAMFNLSAAQRLAEVQELAVTDVRAVGRDWRFTARVLGRRMRDARGGSATPVSGTG